MSLRFVRVTSLTPSVMSIAAVTWAAPTTIGVRLARALTDACGFTTQVLSSLPVCLLIEGLRFVQVISTPASVRDPASVWTYVLFTVDLCCAMRRWNCWPHLRRSTRRQCNTHSLLVLHTFVGHDAVTILLRLVVELLYNLFSPSGCWKQACGLYVLLLFLIYVFIF